MTKVGMGEIYAAANTASRIYNASFRRGNIVRATNMLRNRALSRRLIDFYLDEIDREINHMLSENGRVA